MEKTNDVLFYSKITNLSPLGIVMGTFRSNISIELLWGLSLVSFNLDEKHFKDDLFKKWITKTWNIEPIYERFDKLTVPLIEKIGGWKIQCEFNDKEVQTLEVPFQKDKWIVCLGTVDVAFANHVVYANGKFQIVLKFEQPLLKSTCGSFTAFACTEEFKGDAVLLDQVYRTLYSNFLLPVY